MALQRTDDRFTAGFIGYTAQTIAVVKASPGQTFVVVGDKWADEVVPANCTHVPTFSEFLLKLTSPRTFVVSDDYATNAAKLLGDAEAGVRKGDVVVDFTDASLEAATAREADVAAADGGYLGVWSAGSVKGGTFMVGGTAGAFTAEIAGFLGKVAAHTAEFGADDYAASACVADFGSVAAAHSAKAVHDGLAASDVQAIAEAYDVLRQIGRQSSAALALTFEEWNDGELKSVLVANAAQVFKSGDALEAVADVTEEGWAAQPAAQRMPCLGSAAAAVDTRRLCSSSAKKERARATITLHGPKSLPDIDSAQLLEDVERAVWATKVVSYAQALSTIAAVDRAAVEHSLRVWQAGSPLQSRLLAKIKLAFDAKPDLAHLLLAAPSDGEGIIERLVTCQPSWRRIVSLCVASGLPCAALGSALSYFDSYRRSRLTANLSEALRNFGDGTYAYRMTDGASKAIDWQASGAEEADATGAAASK